VAAGALVPLGCTTLQGRDPLQVTVAGIEPLESQGMEMRMLVKLRVQNPNDAPVDYNGVALEMNVNGKTLGTGVSDTGGSVPRFGEAIIGVPVTFSAFRMLSHGLSMIQSAGSGPIKYEMKGKLNATGFNSMHFHTQGEFALPSTAATDTGS
jgi:LEA14-like dessication related protein